MVQPIQYQVPGVADPFANVVQGLRLGSSLAEMDAARATQALKQQQLEQQIEKRQMEMQRQQQLSTAYTSLLDKVRSDTWKPEDFQQVAFLAPKEMAETTLKSWERLSKDRQTQTLSDTTKAMAALGSKNPELGVQFLTQRAAAYRNQGNEDQAKWLETQAKLAEVDPVQVRAMLGSELYGLPGGKDAIEALAKAEGNRRAAELQPEALKQAVANASEAVAKAKKAQAEAATAADKEAADVRLKKAQADEAEVKARVARLEEKLTGGVGATPEIRTAIAATNLPDNQKRALVELANVKAPKTVIDMGAGAEAKARGESLVKEYEGLRDTAVASKKLLGNLEVAENILNKADFSTGFGTETKAAAASVFSALGVPQATQFATDAQTFLAQAREALLQKSILQKGTQTEGDAKRINETGAALGNTKDANKFIFALAKTVAQRDIDKAKFYARYDKENKTFRGADAAWEESPEGSKSIFDYPAMRPFRNIQAPPAPAPARPAAAAPAAAVPAPPPGFGPRAVTGTVTPAESFPVAPQPATPTESTEAMIERLRRKYGNPR